MPGKPNIHLWSPGSIPPVEMITQTETNTWNKKHHAGKFATIKSESQHNNHTTCDWKPPPAAELETKKAKLTSHAI